MTFKCKLLDSVRVNPTQSQDQHKQNKKCTLMFTLQIIIIVLFLGKTASSGQSYTLKIFYELPCSLGLHLFYLCFFKAVRAIHSTSLF